MAEVDKIRVASPSVVEYAETYGLDLSQVPPGMAEGRITLHDVMIFRASLSAAAVPVAASSGVPVTPAIAKLADQNGVDLRTVHGTGVGRRVQKSDVLNAAAAANPMVDAPATLHPLSPAGALDAMSPMDRAALCVRLGLPPAATDQQILAAYDAQNTSGAGTHTQTVAAAASTAPAAPLPAPVAHLDQMAASRVELSDSDLWAAVFPGQGTPDQRDAVIAAQLADGRAHRGEDVVLSPAELEAALDAMPVMRRAAANAAKAKIAAAASRPLPPSVKPFPAALNGWRR